MAFIDEIKERARTEKKRIILPEGMDRRVWEAAVTVFMKRRKIHCPTLRELHLMPQEGI